MKNSYFLDTSYAIALAVPKDPFHERAIALSLELEKAKSSLITSRAIILEIGNALSRQPSRRSGVTLLQKLESDPRLLIVEISKGVYQSAFRLFSERLDKEWGLIDCVSFVVMKERRINLALTTDVHFVQAGFSALLREE